MIRCPGLSTRATSGRDDDDGRDGRDDDDVVDDDGDDAIDDDGGVNYGGDARHVLVLVISMSYKTKELLFHSILILIKKTNTQLV